MIDSKFRKKEGHEDHIKVEFVLGKKKTEKSSVIVV